MKGNPIKLTTTESIKVSVIMPTYNVPSLYLCQCLDSIFKQTLRDIELICVDDGSTDGTLAILEEYSEKHENMHIYKQNRKGPGPARNLAMNHASGEFIAFMDADDYYPSDDVLSTLYNGAAQNHVKLAAGTMLYLEGNKFDTQPEYVHIEREEVRPIQEYQTAFDFTCRLFDRKTIIDNEVYFPDLVSGEDPVFMVDFLAKTERVWVTPKPTYVYRMRDKIYDKSGRRCVHDYIKSVRMRLEISEANGLEKIQKEAAKELAPGGDGWSCAHIYCGDDRLLSEIQACVPYITDKELRCEAEAFWTKENVKKYVDEEKDKNAALYEAVRNADSVIIYGAGVYGICVYNFIDKMENVNFSGFAVSQKSSGGWRQTRCSSTKCEAFQSTQI